MFYENEYLSEKVKNIFRDFYKEKPQLVRSHTKAFNNYKDKYFELANKILFFGENKYINFVKKNKKYIYDQNFSYLEKMDNLIILRLYYLNSLERIWILDLETNSQYAYAVKYFKSTNAYLMANASEMRMNFYDGWERIYSHEQRLRDAESIKILKSMDKFKYLPLEKFSKINYFLLFMASDEAIYNYELLLKLGATRAATELMLNREVIDRNTFKKYKDSLLKNRTYKYIKTIKQSEELAEMKEKEKMTDKRINDKLQRYQKLFWEYSNYIFRVPLDLEDLKKESEDLKHCLYSQRKYYLNNSFIVFLRKKDDINSPFFTIEIKNNQISQCRTENNQTDEVIEAIANEWFETYKDELLSLSN